MSAQAGPSRRTRNRGEPASVSTVRRSPDRRNPCATSFAGVRRRGEEVMPWAGWCVWQGDEVGS